MVFASSNEAVCVCVCCRLILWFIKSMTMMSKQYHLFPNVLRGFLSCLSFQ